VRVVKGDTVVVLSGDDRGKRGRVLKADPKAGIVVVEKVNFVKRHTRARRQGMQGGILEKEAPVKACTVQVVCPKCDRGTRVGIKVLADGTRERSCGHCGEVLPRTERKP
jgi:large subunit ribosomal protein L24